MTFTQCPYLLPSPKGVKLVFIGYISTQLLQEFIIIYVYIYIYIYIYTYIKSAHDRTTIQFVSSCTLVSIHIRVCL